MTVNLFAACREGVEVTAKRVPLAQGVQHVVSDMFEEQERAFWQGITEEVPFDGDWKAESNEVLKLRAEEARVFVEPLESNALSVPVIDTAEFAQEGIRGLFVRSHSGDGVGALVQLFTAAQVLSRRFPLILEGNRFQRMSQPAFTFTTKLMCVVRGDVVWFKSYANLRKVLGNMGQYLRAATDGELRAFGRGDVFSVEDEDSFIAEADETVRKLVCGIVGAKTLESYSGDEIEAAARSVGIQMARRNGRLMLPTEKFEMKKVLRFLDDGLYEAPLTRRRYMTNSKRPVA